MAAFSAKKTPPTYVFQNRNSFVTQFVECETGKELNLCVIAFFWLFLWLFFLLKRNSSSLVWQKGGKWKKTDAEKKVVSIVWFVCWIDHFRKCLWCVFCAVCVCYRTFNQLNSWKTETITEISQFGCGKKRVVAVWPRYLELNHTNILNNPLRVRGKYVNAGITYIRWPLTCIIRFFFIVDVACY